MTFVRNGNTVAEKLSIAIMTYGSHRFLTYGDDDYEGSHMIILVRIIHYYQLVVQLLLV